MVRHIILFSVLLGAAAAQGTISFTIPFDTVTWMVEHDRGYERIDAPSGMKWGVPGDPELPVYTYTYLIPHGTRVADIEVSPVSWMPRAHAIRLFPRQIDYPLWVPVGERAFTEADYGDKACYPHTPVVSYTSGTMRGFSCLQIAIVPFIFHPGSGDLWQAREIQFNCRLEACEAPVSPARESRNAYGMTERLIASAVSNSTVLSDPLYRYASMIDDRLEQPGAYSEPSYDGAPIDLLIITDAPQHDAYTEYARMSGLLGYNATVRTISWIRQRYSGVDDAERIRAFIRDAVIKWGVLYVLLGGDTPVIPARWVHMEPLFDRWPVHIVSDLYYADLDGTWNKDGDARFGEIEDSLDLFPDVIVSRLPTMTPYQVNAYRGKVFEYVTATAAKGLTRALFITSDFEITNDAYDMAKRLAGHLPAYFDTVFLNERPLQEVVDSLNRGFGLVYGLGHGDNNNLRIRNNPRENAYNHTFDSLVYNTCRGAMQVITCYTNTVQTDCLSEHWILNRHGGGWSYIGPTCSSEAYLHEEFTKELMDSMFSMPLGAAHIVSKVPFVSQAQWDNWYRLYEFSITMLGDPTVSLWDSIPHKWMIVNRDKDTVQCGTDTVTFYCAPFMPFSAVFSKDGEVFARDTSDGVVLRASLDTETPGYIRYALHADGFHVHIDSLYVAAREPSLHVDHVVVDDASGNNNGVANPGETLSVFVYVKNSGGGKASSIRGVINCSDQHMAIISDSAYYPDLLCGMIAKNEIPYILYCDSIPDAYQFDIGMVLDHRADVSDSMRTAFDTLQMTFASSVLRHDKQIAHATSMQESVVVTIAVDIRNAGHECAHDVEGRIRALSDSVTVIDSLVVFPSIPPGAVASSGNDVFRLALADTSTAIAYEYSICENGSTVNTMQVVIDTPGATGSIRTAPCDRAIRILWQPVNGATGYRVLRSVDPDTGYTRISGELVCASTYDDYAVSAGERYYYRIVAVDQYMNHGSPSAWCSGSLAPPVAQGWPQPVYDYLFSSCAVGELDPFYPGYEIVVCGKDGRVYAWHCDGSPIADEAVILDIHTTQVWTSPAVGDLDGDGTCEIVFGVRRSTDNLYAISPYGQSLHNWPLTIPGQFIGSPVLADLDANGDLEIIVWTLQADVYVLNHDGSGFFTPTGLLIDLPGIAFGAPAVGDLDRDGMLEIVCAGGSGGDSLYVWDHQGILQTPFPVYIQSQGLTYSTVLADICGDARLEILFYADETERVYAVDADGIVVWSVTLGSVADIEGSPVVGDVTGDGHPEVVCGYQTGFCIVDSLGTVLNGYPDTTHDAKLPVIGDIDGDNRCEALVGSVDWNLHAYTWDRTQVPGFPMFFNNRIESCPGLFDIDGDGFLELMVGGNGLFFHVYDLATTVSEWPLFRYDQYNSGTYRSGNLLKLKERTAPASGDGRGLHVQPTVFTRAVRIGIPLDCMAPNDPYQHIVIRDVCGRSVATIDVPNKGQYVDVQWNGCDDNGRASASGVYFITFSSGTRAYTTKVIMVK